CRWKAGGRLGITDAYGIALRRLPQSGRTIRQPQGRNLQSLHRIGGPAITTNGERDLLLQRQLLQQGIDSSGVISHGYSPSDGCSVSRMVTRFVGTLVRLYPIPSVVGTPRAERVGSSRS